ncbi:Opacity protein [Pseudidiomarina planktonica]|uniref:Opacity protein n=1 Tax=Pseudidiomarina planktonica TaxID=1323738 RepID=A0A1Y6E5D2_9GAMM|nr:porin family protein [Pseudidiomarina planktonica]RUO66451.1 porin family protein [Pseudidiomarina planktonica]SMQ57965.1 Opacity protein [Pseudidiomarina planktonica]
MIKRNILAASSMLLLFQANTAVANAEFGVGVAQHRADFRLANGNRTLDSTALTLTGRYHFKDNFSVGARILSGINDSDDSELSGGLSKGYEIFVGTQHTFGNEWSVFGDTGLVYADVDFTTPDRWSDIRFFGFMLRAGVAYELTRNINLNIDYSWHDGSNGEVVSADTTQTIGLSIGYKF